MRLRSLRAGGRRSDSRVRDAAGASASAPASVTQRPFEVGPQPENWPKWFGYESIRELDPRRPMRSALAQHWRLLVGTTLISIATFSGSVLISWALGFALDSGIERGLHPRLALGLLVLAAAITFRALGAFSEVPLLAFEMRASNGLQEAMIAKVAGVRRGGRERISSGEIVAAVTTDASRVGRFVFNVPEAIAATLAFVVTCALMLKISVPLGLFVAVGMPIVIVGMSFVVKPLQTRLDVQREERGKLTTFAADAVAGLRVLRGVGGEQLYAERYAKQSDEVRDAGIRAAGLQALLRGLNSAVPGIFTVIVVGGGLWQVYSGQISYGELVSFYGYTLYLGVPISKATEFFNILSEARVGVRRIAKVMAMTPLTNDDAARPGIPIDWSRVQLEDPISGVVLEPGKLTAIVSAHPQLSAEILTRWARTDDETAGSVRLPVDVGGAPGEGVEYSGANAARPLAEGTQAGASSWTMPLRELPLAQVREGVVLSEAVAHLFQGRLRSNLEAANADQPLQRAVGAQMADSGDGAGQPNREHVDNGAHTESEVMLAMIAADATDIIQGLEGGLDGYVAERGRSLSGGQRQRVALARAILRRAPILLLVEPTSAVDSHTEARIAARLAGERRGMTTAVVTTSPIVLGHADEVILLDDAGRQAARGTHAQLVRDPRYHAIVHRGQGEPDGVGPAAPVEPTGTGTKRRAADGAPATTEEDAR